MSPHALFKQACSAFVTEMQLCIIN